VCACLCVLGFSRAGVGVTGCADVNEPLCGSSYTVYCPVCCTLKTMVSSIGRAQLRWILYFRICQVKLLESTWSNFLMNYWSVHLNASLTLTSRVTLRSRTLQGARASSPYCEGKKTLYLTAALKHATAFRAESAVALHSQVGEMLSLSSIRSGSILS